MIEKVIAFSIRNKFLILLTTMLLSFFSYYAIKNTPLDALPDLSPPQVIVKINWAGQSPKIIEDQGTYPLVSQFLSIADIDTVRGYSTYENGLIYIIFKEGTDLYWARTRVLEQLSSINSSLPTSMKVSLGPDSSGTGWVYQYALKSKTKNLSELRTLQDYYYKYALLGVDGVSEVASVGGFVPTYQVSINNDNMLRYNLSISDIKKVLQENNSDTGGGLVLQNGFEWVVQAKAYLKDLDNIRELHVATKAGVPITIGDIARVELTPSPRRGLAELNGEGEVVGGIVMVRYGEDSYSAIKRIKAKLKTLHVDDVDVVSVYDRSSLIESAVETLKHTLFEESLIVVFVIAVFLMHLRSSLIVLIILPLTIAFTFLAMKLFGIGSNIMSLGGIAIAIGAMVDASIVMIENAYKSLHRFQEKNSRLPRAKERVDIILDSSKLVGRPIFFALALVVVSFLPIFALSGQEGLLFTPLAYTKTFAMAVGALLSITLVPVLMIFFIRGDIPDERKNLLNRFFIWVYHFIYIVALRLKYVVLVGVVVSLTYIYPLYKDMKWEFMPMFNEQSFMYMPVTPYGISVEQVKKITVTTNKIIKQFPEVENVFAKAGRANTATDPAPLSMIESIITFKPKSQWRDGMTYEKLKEQMKKELEIPGLVNMWTYPIRGRIDMLLSGIKTPLGLKVYGQNNEGVAKISSEIENKLREFELTSDVIADQANTGYYIDLHVDEESLQRYAITKNKLLEYVSLAIGGMKISTLYKGLERYPITLRLEEDERRSIDSIKNIQIKTKLGFVPLSTFADVSYKEDATVIKSEMATPVTLISITPKDGVSATNYKQQAQKILESVKLDDGYYYEWAGSSEYLESAMKKIVWIVPSVLVIIFVLIYLALRSFVPTLIVFFTLPFALLGGLIYIEYLGFSMSIAVIVGFLALLGIAAETAIVMIVYLQQSLKESMDKYKDKFTVKHLNDAIYDGAVQRVRPKLMSVFAIIAGLIPIMYTNEVGSEVMQRIAAPMLGGVISSAVLSLVIIPILFEIYAKSKLTKED